MSCWNKDELEQMLYDVVNVLNLSDAAIAEHGPRGTAPAKLVKIVLDQKDMTIRNLRAGMVDCSPNPGQPLLDELARLNKLVADLTAETREALAAMWAAVEPAMFELDHIASADCCCDQSVGVTCVACACQAAVNTIRKWYESPNPGQALRDELDRLRRLEAAVTDDGLAKHWVYNVPTYRDALLAAMKGE